MPGGAPANVAVAIAKLGGTAAFAGSVGQDAFGDFLVETVENNQVDTKNIKRETQSPTTIAFVSLTADGERDFQFNRGAGQYFHLDAKEMAEILSSSVIHFGSATALLPGKLRDTYFQIMQEAKERGKFISFAPNFRQDLWGNDKALFKELCEKASRFADFVKVSEEELLLLTGVQNVSIGVEKLHALGVKIVTVTLGKAGTFLSFGNEQALIPSIEVKVVDSTGAGDAFVGAMLVQLEKKSAFLDFATVRKMVGFANKIGAMVCTKMGSLSAIPSKDEVTQLLARQSF